MISRIFLRILKKCNCLILENSWKEARQKSTVTFFIFFLLSSSIIYVTDHPNQKKIEDIITLPETDPCKKKLFLQFMMYHTIPDPIKTFKIARRRYEDILSFYGDWHEGFLGSETFTILLLLVPLLNHSSHLTAYIPNYLKHTGLYQKLQILDEYRKNGTIPKFLFDTNHLYYWAAQRGDLRLFYRLLVTEHDTWLDKEKFKIALAYRNRVFLHEILHRRKDRLKSSHHWATQVLGVELQITLMQFYKQYFLSDCLVLCKRPRKYSN